MYLGIILLLAFYAYLDIKNERLENEHVIIAGALVLILNLVNGNLAISLLLGVFGFILGYLFWLKGALGGADAKFFPVILMALPFTGMPNMLALTLFFFIWLSIFTGCYYVAYRIGKGKKELPFIPIMFLAYLATYLFRFG